MKTLLLLAILSVHLLVGCSAKDAARLDAAIAVADAVVEIAAPAEEGAAPAPQVAAPAENEPATR